MERPSWNPSPSVGKPAWRQPTTRALMGWRILADGILLLHLGFIIFVLTGGFLVIRWRWLIRLHLPAALWGAALEFGGWTCPLTPLENWLRRAGGEAGYEGGFLERYLLPIIYPSGITPAIQFSLGLGVILVNLVAYALVFRHRFTR